MSNRRKRIVLGPKPKEEIGAPLQPVPQGINPAPPPAVTSVPMIRDYSRLTPMTAGWGVALMDSQNVTRTAVHPIGEDGSIATFAINGGGFWLCYFALYTDLTGMPVLTAPLPNPEHYQSGGSYRLAQIHINGEVLTRMKPIVHTNIHQQKFIAHVTQTTKMNNSGGTTVTMHASPTLTTNMWVPPRNTITDQIYVEDRAVPVRTVTYSDQCWPR